MIIHSEDGLKYEVQWSIKMIQTTQHVITSDQLNTTGAEFGPEPLVILKESLACSWSFFAHTSLIWTLACSFLCFRTFHYETRLLVIGTLLNIQENLECTYIPLILRLFYTNFFLILTLDCSFACIRASHHEIRMHV